MASCCASRHLRCVFLCVLLTLTRGLWERGARLVICAHCTPFLATGAVICLTTRLHPPPNTHRAIHYLEPCPIECNVTSTAPSTVMKKTTLTSMDSMRHNDWTSDLCEGENTDSTPAVITLPKDFWIMCLCMSTFIRVCCACAVMICVCVCVCVCVSDMLVIINKIFYL